jgi:hypothetical protein
MKKDIYFETVAHIERLHRLFLELIHLELEKLEVYDISNVQSLILYNLGGETRSLEDMAHGGYYLGSNIAWNVRKMVESGYMEPDDPSPQIPQEKMRFRLSPQGRQLRQKLDRIFTQQAGDLEKKGVAAQAVQQTSSLLHKIEDCWKSQAAAAPSA